LEDGLNLAKSLDESLSNLSSKGDESRIIFIDTREYPDACKISGSYTYQGDKIALRYKIKCGDKTFEYAIEGGTKEELIDKIIMSLSDIK
jgi:hypothetical protein